MKREMDCIRFESRREIEKIQEALNVYNEEHSEKENSKDVELLSNLLEDMHMNW